MSCLAVPGRTARAQATDNLASAEALFDEGKRLMAAGDFAHACPKLAASLRLDVGIGAMLYLAECYVHSGQTASAWGQFREAAALAAGRRDAREALARERAQQLEPQLSKLLVRVSQPEGPETIVRRDGQVLDRAAWATLVPVDPGVHVVEASAPGKRTFRATIAVEPDASISSVVVPPLEDLTPPPRPVVPRSATPLAAEASRPTALPVRGGSFDVQRAIAIAVAGLGLVGAGTGAYWGLHAKKLLDDSNANGHCAGNQCDLYGVQARANAQGQADSSSVALAAGGIALVASAVLWLTAPRAQARTALLPQVGPRAPSFAFAFRF